MNSDTMSPSNYNNSSHAVVLNITENSFPGISPAKAVELIAWIATTLAISFLGSISNVIVLVVTWPKSVRKSGFNLQIFHFVAANLFMCLLGIPISVYLVMVKRHGYHIPLDICNYIYPPLVTVNAVVNWSDVGLALNRVVALCAPHKYRAWSSKRGNVAMIASYWIISLAAVLLFPLHVGGSKLAFTPLGQCTLVLGPPLGVFGLVIITYYPFAMTGACVVVILWKSFMLMRERRRTVRQLEEDRKYRAVLRRLTLAKMLLLIFLWTALCAAPGFIITSSFPRLFTANPVSVLWFRTCAVCQFAFTPVWNLTRQIFESYRGTPITDLYSIINVFLFSTSVSCFFVTRSTVPDFCDLWEVVLQRSREEIHPSRSEFPPVHRAELLTSPTL